MLEETKIALRNYEWLIRDRPESTILAWEVDTLIDGEGGVVMDTLCEPGYTPATADWEAGTGFGEIADLWAPPQRVTVGTKPGDAEPDDGFPGTWPYSLRVQVTPEGTAGPVEIGFPDWDSIADWLVSPGRWAYGSVKSITIAGERTAPVEDGHDEISREYQHDKLTAATRILAVIDKQIDGEQDAKLGSTDLGWLRAMLLDQIELAEHALGLEHAQSPESVMRTIRHGLQGGQADGKSAG